MTNTVNNKFDFVCPHCEGALKAKDDNLNCRKCNKSYFSILGIYDFSEAYSSAKERLRDDEKSRALYDNFDAKSYDELVRIEGELNSKWMKTLPKEIGELYADFGGNMIARGKKRYMEAMSAIESFGAKVNTKNALDIGCSSGATLFHISKDFERSVGIEPSFSKLILAKKYMDENGIDNVTLVCGFGEVTPFKSGSFDFIHALNVIEHVGDQAVAIEKMHALLTEGGALAFDSRNRYDIFKPEPHVKVRFVGFLPRRLQGKYVKFSRGMEYTGIRLLSYFELKSLLKPLFGRNFTVTFPKLTGTSRTFSAVYGVLKKIPVISYIFKIFFPTYQVVGVKK